MSKLSPARVAALAALVDAERSGRFVRDVLGDTAGVASGISASLDSRDQAFALRLALGATATRGCLDELLDRFLSRPQKVAPRVRWALRLAAFELLYLQTAPHVAVSQGVELVRSVARGAAGMANAVLRRVANAREAYLSASDLEPAGSAASCVGGLGQRVSTGPCADGHMKAASGEPRANGRGQAASAEPRANDYDDQAAQVAAARSCGLPTWLGSAIQESCGASAADLFASELEPAPVALHVNPLHGAAGSDIQLDNEKQRAAGEQPGGSCVPASVLPGCRIASHVAAAVRSGALADGDAVVSDMNAQLVATAAVRPGSCLEIGSGRGTKTFVMACQRRRLGLDADHVAADLSAKKGELNRERLEAAGLSQGVAWVSGDCQHLDDVLVPVDAAAGKHRQFDTVFLDAPCSGTGTMRRHPEIPWRLAAKDVEADLPTLQLALLKEASTRVADGGELIYATCSVLHEENAAVVQAFLASPEGRGFLLVPVSEAYAFGQVGYEDAAAYIQAHEEDGCFQTYPAPQHFDGHFCARFIRRK
ncbi:RsmB/NOP family class I SAM-dependent RNA methyltransferase [Collinsella sp. An2]|uniref:RsmB/NOP family class I SAM-dependent RNA methyltransferase n=1 Tax=Collinsella sp. An2 TaxID=1965585 RepID=UPI001302A3B0|nr:RsmB/NOP family class I SAM-dependent RNA methyltransferase [Collinsella sp. An2]